MRLELPILALNPRLRNVALRQMSDLRCRARDELLARTAGLGRHDREAVWPWWRARGDRRAGFGRSSLSTDHDPLFEAHQWQANLRILEIDELKTVP